jgi:hypothetical protein
MAHTVQARRQFGLTAAEKFWYVLGCIMLGMAYLRKVPVKRALADFGLVEMTSAESFWYVLGCIFPPGMAYLAKVSVAKALSELEQFRTAEHVQLQVPQHEALPGTGDVLLRAR